MTTEALTVYDQPAALPVERTPGEIISNAAEIARVLMDVVEKTGAFQNFNGHKYLKAEGWQMVAEFSGCAIKTEDVKFVKYDLDDEFSVSGFTATAVAIRKSTGVVIGRAEADCLSDERNWKDKDLFQLKSMAQTRALGKVGRMLWAFIANLAGFEGTPAEEMTEGVGGSTVKMPQSKSAPGPRVTEVFGAVEVLTDFKVVAIDEKSGSTWHLTKAVADTGLELSTFDKDLGLTLKTAYESGARLTATWKREESKKKPGMFNNTVLTLEGAEEAREAAQSELGI